MTLKVVDLLGIKSDISRYGTPYTIAEMQFSYIHKGKKAFIIMAAFDDIAKSLKYFEKGTTVEVEFLPSTKFIKYKPITGCAITSIKRTEEIEETEHE